MNPVSPISYEHSVIDLGNIDPAAIKRWDTAYFLVCDHAIQSLHSSLFFQDGYLALKKLLYQARADLRMNLGLLSVVVPQSQVFEYFDELGSRLTPGESPLALARVDITARAESRQRIVVERGVSRPADSATVAIAIRNR